MNVSNQTLSDVTVFMKYAKYIPQLGRRETWDELISRNKNMHLEKYPNLAKEIIESYRLVYDKKVLPSMRSLQFGGRPISINPARIFNCSYTPMNDFRSFSEVMFLLLSGVGVGFSVQKHHVEELPIIRKPTGRNRRYLISDSIEGWADAVKILFKSYYGTLNSKPTFDFSDIRPKGAGLITSGGKAPGPEPLRICLTKIESILREKEDGQILTTLEVHDIVCEIADAVLSGGIRRSACISLFSFDDEEMLSCKAGNWYEENPQRARSNNSVVALRHRINKKDFEGFWERVKYSNAGEPGIYFSNDPSYGTNPCAEIALRDHQMCNLVEINATNIRSQGDLNERAEVASFIATLQAGYTDFHYLRDVWKRQCEKDALLGVSMTGICSGRIYDFNLKEAVKKILTVNEETASEIGINKAARTTCVKPAGTTSLVLGSSSGIHGWHAPYYIRRVRVGKNESLYGHVEKNIPNLVDDDFEKPHLQAVFEFPQKAPENAIYRTESPIDTLERVQYFYENWVVPGHRSGNNKHNISATVSIKEEEWDTVGKWMWNNNGCYNGLTVMPWDYGSYRQLPFEEIDKKEYNKRMKDFVGLNMKTIKEEDDNTDLQGEIACAGGKCDS